MSSIGEDADSVTLRCPAPGEGVAFLPVRDAVVEAAGFLGWRGLHRLLAEDHDGQHVAPEIATAIGLRARPESVAVLFPAVRRLFEALASRRPLIVVLEDLHWAEPTYLDLVAYLAEEATGTDLPLVPCPSRPRRATPRLGFRRPRGARAAVDDRRRKPRRPPCRLDRAGCLRRIVEMSEGNPLFAEQLLIALGDGPVRTVPASLRGSSRCGSTASGRASATCSGARRSSVSSSDSDAVSELLPPDARPFLERHLESMERRHFIQRTGPNTFRFGHALIRMAAYQSIAREDRAALHGQLGRVAGSDVT